MPDPDDRHRYSDQDRSQCHRQRDRTGLLIFTELARNAPALGGDVDSYPRDDESQPSTREDPAIVATLDHIPSVPMDGCVG